MPLLIQFGLAPFLAFFLGTNLASIVFRTFSLLGIGIITYVGSDGLITAAENLFLSYVNELPAGATDVLGYVGFDTSISMIFSAYSIRFTLVTARRFLGVREKAAS